MSLFGMILANAVIIVILIPIIYRGIPFIFKIASLHLTKKSITASDPDEVLFNTKVRIIDSNSVESGSGVGSNIYLSLWYDCRDNSILIRGTIPETQHWSIVPYDIGTSYPINSWLEKDSVSTETDGSYKVIISKYPETETNAIDVSESPLGLILFRYTNPADPQKALSELPVVEVVPKNRL